MVAWLGQRERRGASIMRVARARRWRQRWRGDTVIGGMPDMNGHWKTQHLDSKPKDVVWVGTHVDVRLGEEERGGTGNGIGVGSPG